VPVPSASRRVTRSWRTTSESVPGARHHTRTVLGDWGLLAVIEDAEVIVSELFTNALQASVGDASMIGLRLSADHDHLLIMVWDSSAQMPAARHASPADVDGRGLMIVEALSDACGTAPGVNGGKTVWVKMLLRR
jgi:anti-sigma regulatory factor (Ser/Thr protein kinase)